MRPNLPLWHGLAAVALCAVLAGCTREGSPVSTKAKTEINGPPDLLKDAKWDDRWHAYQLRTFQINHIWAGAGRAGDGTPAFRTKLTVWDYNGPAPVAELYFHDTPTDYGSPNPKDAPRPYQIHFPMSVMGALLGTLRNANDRVYLYYYEGQWAVGVAMPELVGID